MKICTEKNNDKLTIALLGRLDTMTAPELEATLEKEIVGISSLTFDFAEVEYISSAGLRVLLAAQKTMNKQGSLNLVKVRDPIMEVADMTEFCYILDIE